MPFFRNKNAMTSAKLFIALLPLLLLATGCSTSRYRSGMKTIHKAYATGDFDTALAVTSKHIVNQPRNATSNNMLVWRLNHAVLLDAAGRREQAEDQWEIIQPVFEEAWKNDRIHIVGDTVGLLVPGTKDKYYPRPHEGVMVYTYRMLNALILGDIDEARRFLVAAMEFRDEVIKENEARVEKRKECGMDNSSDLTEAAITDELEKKNNTDANKGKDESLKVSGSLLSKLEEKRRQEELRVDLEGYANYANPLTGFLTYLFLNTQGTGLRLTDRANMLRELDELSVFTSNSVVHDALTRDVDTPLANRVYIFFETGVAPCQEEERFEIPIPTTISWFPSYWGIAYPKLVPNSNYVPYLQVSATGQSDISTETLVDFDAITQQSFNDAWPGVIARQISQSVVTTVINAAIKYAANKAADNIDNIWVRWGTKIFIWGGTAALSYVMIEADTRSWELLPKQVQVAQLDIPENRMLHLSFPSGSWSETLTLDEGDVMAVWVKSTSSWQAAPLATQFKFK